MPINRITVTVRITDILQNGFILAKCLHPQPVTKVLEDGSVREVIASFVSLEDHLRQKKPVCAKNVCPLKCTLQFDI